jgi:hypothetical protein
MDESKKIEKYTSAEFLPPSAANGRLTYQVGSDSYRRTPRRQEPYRRGASRRAAFFFCSFSLIYYMVPKPWHDHILHQSIRPCNQSNPNVRAIKCKMGPLRSPPSNCAAQHHVVRSFPTFEIFYIFSLTFEK